MDTPVIVLIIGIALVIAAAVAWVVMRNMQHQRSDTLKRRFGSEYDHAVAERGSRAKAEADLLAREKRVERLDIRPLSPADRERFAARWRTAQASFVDNPAAAVADAETLLNEVLRARGYPVTDFEARAADLSVDHARLVQNYREAHAIALAAQRGTARTEDMRRATIYYRDLFEDLLEETSTPLTAEVRR